MQYVQKQSSETEEGPLIVVEGKTDKEFLEQYIEHKLGYKYDIIYDGGNELRNDKCEKIKKALYNERRVCIIFDADLNYADTLKRIQKQLKDKGLWEDENNKKNFIDIFLFPNNKDQGELETLLIKIIPAEYKEAIECFDKYVECIQSKLPDTVKNIHKKSKMYAYREISGLEKEFQKTKNKDSLWEKYFDFESDVLQPLYDFLFSNSHQNSQG